MSLGVERELQRLVDETEARAAASEAKEEIGEERNRAIVDIPHLHCLEKNLLAQISREWAESAIMKMLGMRKLLRDCAKVKTLQTRLALEPVITPVGEPP
ncbi:hypothetical protein RHSIM_Rhsim04G0127900 [Rhododendron simsii]|uniref:Uncharacterized protein n=1 Tax=Rhododendron simsii TaxID=118357 RepID=A0A834H1L9_RHOSS|nr:hypothetical protein RHSIM_Rhsim04G0127900 [Rhododendron simsii]